MARLVVRTQPNPGKTPEQSLLRTQEGDVVDIVNDGVEIRPGTLNSGHYRIIDLPGIPQEALVHLKAAVFDTEGGLVRRRAKTLDIDALRSPEWAGRSEMTLAEVATLTKMRA